MVRKLPYLVNRGAIRCVERYASLVQQFPASENHHHAYPGGMLDHGLEIVAYALKLRQSHLLPVGAPPETQVAQAEAWTAGVAYAALLHDIGKIAAGRQGHLEGDRDERYRLVSRIHIPQGFARNDLGIP